jgi:hypothetical protein
MSRVLLSAAMLAVLFALMVVGIATDPEEVRGTSRPISTASVQRLAGRAAALVDAPVPAGWSVRYVAARPGAPRAQADRRERRIDVFVRAGDVPHRIAHDVAHELGHAWDEAVLTDAARAGYLRGRGSTAVSWWPAGRWSDYASGAGDFAEVFARCHAASPEFRSRVAPPPADACALLPTPVPR